LDEVAQLASQVLADDGSPRSVSNFTLFVLSLYLFLFQYVEPIRKIREALNKSKDILTLLTAGVDCRQLHTHYVDGVEGVCDVALSVSRHSGCSVDVDLHLFLQTRLLFLAPFCSSVGSPLHPLGCAGVSCLEAFWKQVSISFIFVVASHLSLLFFSQFDKFCCFSCVG
jgi:hypothetical protein